MPDITDQEIVVTAYVYNRFGGTSYSTYQWNGGTVYTFGNALDERWFDTDNDGAFDYGRRDEGNGHWSTFRGFVWEGDHSPPPPRSPTETPEEVDPNGLTVEPESGLDSLEVLFSSTPASHEGDVNFSQPTFMSVDDGWFL